MEPAVVDISWLAVIVAAVVKFLIGWGWYSPALFGKQWQELNKMTAADVQAGMVPALIAEAVGDLIMAYILARFVGHYGFGFGIGILVGFMAWLGFVATVLANQIFYERKPQQLIVINGGYLLISLVIMGAIVGVWH
ncbi:MAG TPA: DUF1761 domain-containing protein [Bauldia sp.]|nr:DUF1761 domain-containing protein [Bauldia sp.]